MATEVGESAILGRVCAPDPEQTDRLSRLRCRHGAVDIPSQAAAAQSRCPESAELIRTPPAAMDSRSPSAAGEWPLDASSHPYSFLLFGRFQARRARTEWMQLDGRKMQEIMSYLLLYRHRPHQREVLAGTLWGRSSKPRSRKNLRQSLWQLQQQRQMPEESGIPLLLVGKEWVQVNRSGIWLDVAELETAFEEVRATPGERLSDYQAASVTAGVDLYRGDLLEGWEEDWCVFERERLRAVYLAMLEKLIGYCEATGRFEEGLVHGERLLRHDRAHERAHWRMMRLSHLAGDRTGALRQYDKCRAALDEELGVGPGRLTTTLYEQIRADAVTLTPEVRS